ncbi:MAG: hypothetical protein M3O32_22140, partial [Actinomycetota bacterium]|nr:hypothetical protein [Actinomycetota bacterium]
LHADYQFTEPIGLDDPDCTEGTFGDFRAWPHADIHQRGWEHAGWGYNCGAVLPDDISGFVSLLQLFPDHSDVPIWRAVLHRYAYGHLTYVTSLSAFGIYPLGNCEGELRFFGPSWHGFNGMYAQIARSCMLLARHLHDPHFEVLAQRNLQWIAGANAGTEGPDGTYTGVSWLSGIGAASQRAWSGIPGSIGNGFCANPQFRLVHLDDVVDAPLYSNREDWLVHNGSWLSGLAETSTRPRMKVKVQDGGLPVRAHLTLTFGEQLHDATTNARGVAIFTDLPRLHDGALDVEAASGFTQRTVHPVSGDNLEIVIDFAETLHASWHAAADGGYPTLHISNTRNEAAHAHVQYMAVTDALVSTTERCDVPAGATIERQLPPTLTESVDTTCWLRAEVTGRFTVAETETSFVRFKQS